jgi:hypothetical protein
MTGPGEYVPDITEGIASTTRAAVTAPGCGRVPALGSCRKR